jgi:hypothetical protein
MSKFGMQVAGKTVYGIKTPDKALELVEMVVEQYFGEYWTQHKPRCPLCNNGLSDTEKYMNRPVGECTNEKCDSTIHISDFMGKIKDVLSEWGLAKDTWMEEALETLKAKAKEEANKSTMPTIPTGYDHDDIEVVDEETIFVW